MINQYRKRANFFESTCEKFIKETADVSHEIIEELPDTASMSIEDNTDTIKGL